MNLISKTMPHLIGGELRSTTLQSTAARWTLGASLAGMLVYTAVEYFIDKPESASFFVLHHVTHVAIIAVAVWLASWLVIQKLILNPVSKIFVHLKRMAAGRVEYIDGDMGSRELADVAVTLNQLVAKLSRGKDEASVARGLDSLRDLRRELSRLCASKGDEAVPVMRALTAVEGELLHLLQDAPGTSSVCCSHGGSECLATAN